MRRRFSSRASRGPAVLPCPWILASLRGGITARAPRRSNASYTVRRSYAPSAPAPEIGPPTWSSRAGTASSSVTPGSPPPPPPPPFLVACQRRPRRAPPPPGAPVGAASPPPPPPPPPLDLQSGAV